MRISVGLSIGLAHDKRDVLNIPDEALEGLTPEEVEKVCDEWTKGWAENYIEWWWEKED